MATQTYAQLKVRLNKRLRDTLDITYTSDEKDEFLATAFEDPFAFTISRNASLTTVAQQAAYTLPTEFYEIVRVAIDTNSDGYPKELDRDTYDVIDGSVYFQNVQKYLPSGKSIVIWGKKKLTISDDVPVYLQDYILHVAVIEALEFLKSVYATRFLKNDVTMSDLINSINSHRQRLAELRKSLQNRIEVAG